MLEKIITSSSSFFSDHNDWHDLLSHHHQHNKHLSLKNPTIPIPNNIQLNSSQNQYNFPSSYSFIYNSLHIWYTILCHFFYLNPPSPIAIHLHFIFFHPHPPPYHPIPISNVSLCTKYKIHTRLTIKYRNNADKNVSNLAPTLTFILFNVTHHMS